MADIQLVSHKFEESLAKRAKALGCKLMTDDSEGEYLLHYIYDEKDEKIVFVSGPADQVDDWLTLRELPARTNEITEQSASQSLASAMAAKLIELEHDADEITLEEVFSRYNNHSWGVFEHRTGEAGVFTTANNCWTETGLRHFLALLELYEFSFPEYLVQTGIEKKEPVTSFREESTATIDPDLKH